jgi:tetratricopeptide (TPR) repeat protein
MGDLAPLTPLCPPLLWTSLSTGYYADRHGVLDWQEDDPKSAGVRPVTRQSLQAPHVWEILAQQDVRCQSIGWPVTHPATHQATPSCTVVSDHFPGASAGCIVPEEREVELVPLRFTAADWTGADLQLFVPDLATIDQDRDRRLAQLAVLLAADASIHAAATALLETNSCALTAVWYGAAARAIELFPPDTDAVYKNVVHGVYRFLDLLLGRLLQLAGPESTVLLVSDRAAGEPEFRTAVGSGSQGILCALGPGIQPDELAYGAGALDLAPTLLGLFGYVQPREMPGHVIVEICPVAPKNPLKPSAIATLAAAPSDDAADELQELESLGYRDTVAAAKAPEVARSHARRILHLTRVLLAQGRAQEAIPALEELHRASPWNAEVRLYLAHACLQSGRVDESRKLAEQLLAEHPDSSLAALAGAHLALAEGDFAAATRHLRAARGVYGLSATLDTEVGLAYLRLGNWSEAAEAFTSALAVDPRLPGAHAGLAQAMLAGSRYETAAEAALDAIRLRYDHPGAHNVLGLALEALGRAEAAAGAFAVRDTLLRGASAPR